jgi:hypothetical protein
VARIFAAKGRPDFNPLIVHVPDLEAARRIARLSPEAEALANAFWPGALTLVLPLVPGADIARPVTAGLPTIAIRVPAHPVMQALLQAIGRPLAAPSANPSGWISATTAAHVLDGLGSDPGRRSRRRPMCRGRGVYNPRPWPGRHAPAARGRHRTARRSRRSPGPVSGGPDPRPDRGARADGTPLCTARAASSGGDGTTRRGDHRGLRRWHDPTSRCPTPVIWRRRPRTLFRRSARSRGAGAFARRASDPRAGHAGRRAGARHQRSAEARRDT